MNGSAPSNSLDLLRRLEPVVRAGGSLPKSATHGLFESRSFDELLAGAFAGRVRSDRPVQVAAEVQPPLDAAQLERLAMAADRAEAAGARRALMLLDGRGVIMDVATRSVVAEMKPGDVGDMLRVEAAMVVPVVARDGDRNGSPFAGLNALTSARLSGAADMTADAPHSPTRRMI
jgi:hypothetical protein